MYYIQVLLRRNDNESLYKQCIKLRSYYIRSLQDYDNCRQSIIDECVSKNGRAYIDLNAKDVKKGALLALKKTVELIYNPEYDAVKKVYDHACGNADCIGCKLWLVDIDVKCVMVVENIIRQIQELRGNVVLRLKTKNGWHLLVTPFPLNKFVKVKDVDVIKQGVTLLFCEKTGPKASSHP
jgi:hypothetical protein